MKTILQKIYDKVHAKSDEAKFSFEKDRRSGQFHPLSYYNFLHAN